LSLLTPAVAFSTSRPRSLLFFFFLLTPPPPRSTLFPYTTLFRSAQGYAVTANLDDRRSAWRLHGGWSVNRFLAAEVGYSDLGEVDRKSTRLNSSHVKSSYAVFCLKKKKRT